MGSPALPDRVCPRSRGVLASPKSSHGFMLNYLGICTPSTFSVADLERRHSARTWRLPVASCEACSTGGELSALALSTLVPTAGEKEWRPVPKVSDITISSQDVLPGGPQRGDALWGDLWAWWIAMVLIAVSIHCPREASKGKAPFCDGPRLQSR